jgi:hypothetical protein
VLKMITDIVKLEELHEAYFEYGQSDSYLTFKQAWNAKDYMKKYLPKVFMMIKDLESGYPPELQKEKNNPDIWKEEHWFWFIQNYIRK